MAAWGLAALLLGNNADAGASIQIRTEGGVKRLVQDGGRSRAQVFRADMGAKAGVLSRATLDAGGEAIEAAILSMGNPQCVVLGPLPDDGRFRRLGAALERHREFPGGSNVESAPVRRTPQSVRILIWERGVGPTSWSRRPARAPRWWPPQPSAAPAGTPTSSLPVEHSAWNGPIRVSF